MKYVKTNWVDDVTPVNACNLNKIENAISKLSQEQLGASNIYGSENIEVNVVGNQVRINCPDVVKSEVIREMRIVLEIPEPDDQEEGVMYIKL